MTKSAMSKSHTLEVSGLAASAAGSDILTGVDLEVRSGEVHAIMGPNGSGKSTLSHVLMGKPGYEVTAGSVTLDGVDLLKLTTWERAKAGLFLAMQYPIEVPGVSLVDVLDASVGTELSGEQALPLLQQEAEAIGLDTELLNRSLNVDMSGGEKKRYETMQLSVFKPGIAILDELDSGLDVDGLRVVSQRVEKASEEDGLGVLVITHYSRLLDELKPDVVHILVGGKIVESGGPELAAKVEEDGYASYVADGNAASATT